MLPVADRIAKIENPIHLLGESNHGERQNEFSPENVERYVRARLLSWYGDADRTKLPTLTAEQAQALPSHDELFVGIETAFQICQHYMLACAQDAAQLSIRDLRWNKILRDRSKFEDIAEVCKSTSDHIRNVSYFDENACDPLLERFDRPGFRSLDAYPLMARELVRHWRCDGARDRYIQSFEVSAFNKSNFLTLLNLLFVSGVLPKSFSNCFPIDPKNMIDFPNLPAVVAAARKKVTAPSSAQPS